MAFETIRSASGVDFLGTDQQDVLVAFNESGSIYVGGRQEKDTITFNQNISGVLSTATIQGGQGDDAVQINSALSSSFINGNKDSDDIFVTGFISQSTIRGGQGNDELFIENGASNSLFAGDDGDDRIGFQDDETFSTVTVNGNKGNDTLALGDGRFNGFNALGGEANDTITTGAGASFAATTINGNKGLDTITLAGGFISGGLSVFGGEGADTITTGNYDVSATNDDAVGVYVSGDLGNDQITAGDGDDTILGGDGDDTMAGGDGDDTIQGGAGNDSITGQGGENRIIGGEGADTYTASAGTDVFVIDAITNSNATTSGKVQGFDTFSVGDSFTTTVDELNIEAVSSSLAGGTVNNVNTIGANIAVGPVADWAAVKTALDTAGVLASTTAGINARTFTATVDGVAGTYLWINDTQSAYNAGDLVFKVAAVGQIAAGDIIA